MSPVQSQEHNPLPEHPPVPELRARVERGGAAKYHEANAGEGQAVRPRAGPAARRRGLVRRGRRVRQRRRAATCPPTASSPAPRPSTAARSALMANDSTVKAGSWGARTVEKIIRIIETAYRRRRADGLPRRLRRRPDHRPGRPVPGPARRREDLLEPGARERLDPAGLRAVRPVRGRRRLHPGVLRRRRHGRGQRLDVPRLRPHGRDGDRREDHPRGDGRRPGALRGVRRRPLPGRGPSRRRSTPCAPTCPTCPSNWQGTPPAADAVPPPANVDLAALVPASERQAFDMRRYAKGLLDEGSFFEIHALWAREVTVGFGRLDGEVVGVVGNNSMFKGGVLFIDSADKATRFMQLCDAFNVPLLFLSDVPGFMVGSVVEKAGHHPARRQDDHRDLRGHRAEDLRRRAQGLRRRALRDGRPRLRAGRDPRAADREDRRDGRRGSGQRGLREQDRGDRGRGRAGRVRRRQARASTTRTSTSCGWPASWSSTTSSRRRRCATSWSAGCAPTRGKDRHFSRRRHGVTPV